MQRLQYDNSLLNDLKNSGCVAGYLNPKDRWIYETNETEPEKVKNTFLPEKRRIHIDEFNHVIKLNDEGRLSESEYLDKIRYGIFNSENKSDELAKAYQQVVDAVDKGAGFSAAVAAAGITPADYSGLEVNAMTAIIFGMQERARVLQNALRIVRIAGTKYEYPELTGRVAITRGISYGNTIPIKSAQFTNRTKNLKCDAAHFAWLDDVSYRPRSVDVIRANLEAIGDAFVRDTADQVQEILTDSTITVITGTNWTTTTNNPYIDIAKAMKVIEENHGRGNRIALHDLSNAAFAGNPNTKGTGDASTSRPEEYGAKQLGGKFYAGTDSFIDNSMPLQKATVWDDFFTFGIFGPEGVANYKDVPRFQNGYVTFQWKLFVLADLTKIRILDSLNTFT